MVQRDLGYEGGFTLEDLVSMSVRMRLGIDKVCSVG